MSGYQTRLNNLCKEREVECIDCATTFISNNIQTKRCLDCNTKPVIRKFVRKCCVCRCQFTSRNIYTVTCSQKCGHIARVSGIADRAKKAIKLRAFVKRQSKQVKKAAYEASLMTPEKLVKDCVDTWGDDYEYLVPKDKMVCPEITVVCKTHGKVPFVYNRYEKPSKPCKYCRDSSSVGVFTNTLLRRDVELAARPYKVYLLTGEKFHKVGLTAQDCKTDRIKRLMSSGGFIKSKTVFEGTLLECFELEQFILQEADNYRPDTNFGGHTECLTSDNVHLSEGLL